MKQQSSPNLSSYGSRLRHLHNIISLVPDNMFDLVWYSNWTEDCGTIGCAVGWATQDPVFQKLGLRSMNDWSPLYLDHELGFESIAAFFNLNMEECDNMFSVGSYRSYQPANIRKSSRGKYRLECLKRIQRAYEKAEAHETATAS